MVVLVVVVTGAPITLALNNLVGLMSALNLSIRLIYEVQKMIIPNLNVYPLAENSICFAVSPPGLVGVHLIVD